MANRNRMSGGYNSNRREFGDYNRSFGGGRDSNYGGGRSSQFSSVSPWQGGSAPNVQATEATLALANNLISNLLQTRQSSVPSLLDINVRRDYGYGQGYQGDRRAMNRMGARSMSQGGMNRRGGPPSRQNLPQRRPAKQADKNKVKKENSSNEDGNVESEAAGDGEVKKEEGENAGTEEKTEGQEVKTPYDGINPIFLVCHICEKKMWDGRSFDNHIKGRAHHMMMDKIRESYKMTADAMRQEQRISEMRRERRGGSQPARKVFCAMCDLYVASEGAHRRSPGHQKLKRYLHPSCSTCRKEMPTRIEFEEHRLTPQHMRTLQEKHAEMPETKNDVMQMSSLQEELALIRPLRLRNKKNQQQQEQKDSAEGSAEAQANGEAPAEGKEGEAAQEGQAEGEKMDESVQQEDGPVLILDYQEGDDLSEMKRENLPKYQPDRQLGVSYIQDYTCKQCTLCRKLFDSEETAEVHTKTYKHFQSFLRLLYSKGDFKKPEVTKREVPKDGEGAEDDDGNWKRRKLDDSEAKPEAEEGGESCQEGAANLQDGGDLNGDHNVTECDSGINAEQVQDQEMQNPPDESIQEDNQEQQQQQQQEELQKAPQQVPESPGRTTRGRGRGRGRGAARNRI